jgi:hypothetical protein
MSTFPVRIGVRCGGTSLFLLKKEAIVKDTAALAAPEEPILQEIENSGADLVVIGLDRIQGDALNFGGGAGRS